MAKGYPMCGGAAYNILDLPAPPRDLVVTTAPATIKVQFSASGLEAWTVYKIGGKPRHPYDGWRNIQKMDGGGQPSVQQPLRSMLKTMWNMACGFLSGGSMDSRRQRKVQRP